MPFPALPDQKSGGSIFLIHAGCRLSGSIRGLDCGEGVWIQISGPSPEVNRLAMALRVPQPQPRRANLDHLAPRRLGGPGQGESIGVLTGPQETRPGEYLSLIHISEPTR